MGDIILITMIEKHRMITYYAVVAELADAHGSGPCGLTPVEVRVLSTASYPNNYRFLDWLDATKSLFSYGQEALCVAHLLVNGIYGHVIRNK